MPRPSPSSSKRRSQRHFPWQDLPPELACMIIPDRAILTKLCLVSRSVSAIATPLLYRVMKLHLDWGKDRYLLPVHGHRFLRTVRQLSADKFTFVRELDISIPFPFETGYAECTHSRWLRAPASREGKYMAKGTENTIYEEVRQCLSALLGRIPEGKLRSISLRTRACYAADLLGEAPEFSARQTRIEQLTLVTDDICAIQNLERPIPLLAHCTALRSLAWDSIDLGDDQAVYRDCLQRNSETVTSLSLGRRTSELDAIERQEESARTSVRTLLRLLPSVKPTLLPQLTQLDLVRVSLGAWVNKLPRALNFSGLRYLSLYDCYGSVELIDGILRGGQSIQLEEFRYLCVSCELSDPDYADEQGAPIILHFLQSFKGLKELFLLFQFRSRLIAKGVTHHADTLERVVVDGKNLYADDQLAEDVWTWSQYRMIGIPLRPQMMKVWDFDAHKGPSEIFHLRYPGNRGGRDCIKLVEWVERYFATYGQGRKSNLRQMSEAGAPDDDGVQPGWVEKVRAIIDFARRAFGKGGWPTLRVLAVGEVAIKGAHVFLCRSFRRPGLHAGHVRVVRRSDCDLWATIEQNMQALRFGLYEQDRW